jgi:hypothetical protein
MPFKNAHNALYLLLYLLYAIQDSLRLRYRLLNSLRALIKIRHRSDGSFKELNALLKLLKKMLQDGIGRT